MFSRDALELCPTSERGEKNEANLARRIIL